MLQTLSRRLLLCAAENHADGNSAWPRSSILLTISYVGRISFRIAKQDGLTLTGITDSRHRNGAHAIHMQTTRPPQHTHRFSARFSANWQSGACSAYRTHAGESEPSSYQRTRWFCLSLDGPITAVAASLTAAAAHLCAVSQPRLLALGASVSRLFICSARGGRNMAQRVNHRTEPWGSGTAGKQGTRRLETI
mgnify:CR=1 FL=1